MKTDQIRKKFLNFFETKGHRIVLSDKIVPANDPSLLFTSAGMNQFKEQFLGKVGDFRRAASCQKCLRTADLEKVGKTPYHHTFFEMLGNFSFGDYFKKEAIQWAWEFLTKELQIDDKLLWVSVYKDDQEAFEIWQDAIGLPREKIMRFGPKENFWPANAIEEGPNGPCGPCSEIFFDRGPTYGCRRSSCSPACDCGRFVEVWNLVFTQFNRVEKNKIELLPHKNIDTGMGLERISSCLQGVDTNFEIDIFRPIVESTIDILKLKSTDAMDKVRCIADHIRAVVFAIGDGVIPSNEERGYVIRKLIRRANWFAYQLNYKRPFLNQLVSVVCNCMKEPYPELERQRESISGIILAEEERFLDNIQEGIGYFREIIDEMKAKNITNISSDILFKLYDTYGFPLELTKELAGKFNLGLDLVGFEEKMQQQRTKARLGSKITENIFAKDILQLLPSEFVGYNTRSCQAKIIQLIQDKKNIESVFQGQQAWLILDRTPFYGESGGQVGDTGVIKNLKNELVAEVLDTKRIEETNVHIVKVISGVLKIQDVVLAEVDSQRRQAIQRAHTATHLLQAALRRVLGLHVHQAGSLVEPDHFRFDFTHFRDLKPEELQRIQQLVNEYIRANDNVQTSIMKKQDAEQSGAIALFGEKYGQTVRVVSCGDYSKEFCGGTHLSNTGAVALFLISNESSVGSGIRRIEGFTGELAYDKVMKQIQELQDKLEQANTAVKRIQKQLDVYRLKEILGDIPQIVKNNTIKITDTNLFIYGFKNIQLDTLRAISDKVLEILAKQSISVLFSESGHLICRVSNDLKDKISSVDLIKEILKPLGGSGGGRVDFAQGGFKNRLDPQTITTTVKEKVRQLLSQ